MKFNEFIDDKMKEIDPLLETAQHNRYSIEVNYRSGLQEVIDSFAKLCLGYVSAGLKNCGYHCKTVFSTKPARLLVGTRNWDDGEWICIMTFDHQKNCFMIGDGTYNKDKKTVSINKIRNTEANSAGDLVREMRNQLEKLKKIDPVRSSTIKPIKFKRGPKPVVLIKKKKIKI